MRKPYEHFNKNDSRALPLVQKLIINAKKNSNFKKLTQGYRDMVFFVPDPRDKLIYSDSMIYAAQKSQDNSLISLAYLGKGIIYYFNYKKFEPALDQYLKAYEYSKKSDDQYLKHKVIYHLGVIKSYLGYYQDALEHFNECIYFFESESEKDIHPFEVFNNKRGYYNSLHQMIICYRNIGKLSVTDSLINVGLSKLVNEKDFSLEKSYLLKCRGISKYNKAQYKQAIIDLEKALPELNQKDFSWASVAYFYIGSSYLAVDVKKSLPNFEKVDSIFIKHKFILPEVRKNYEVLIKYYQQEKDVTKELYYTNQLLAVDNLIGKDFSYLSSRIHKEYDTKDLLENKKNLETKSRSRLFVIAFSSLIAVVFIFLFLHRFRKERLIRKRYQKLQQRLKLQANVNVINVQISEDERKNDLSVEVRNDISEKLIQFELKRGFVKRGLSMGDLASELNTNTSYLSIFINEYKGVNFKNYINKLRIEYITNVLNSDRKFLKYTIDALAEECGFTTRQNFSDVFFEINGIRPNDYIRKRKQDLDMPQVP